MKSLLKVCFFLLSSFALAEMPMGYEENAQIRIHNCVLAQVGEKTITTLDLKQHLDLLFYANFPQYASNPLARMQFYDSHWEKVLDELINTQLIILDAEEKQIVTSDGEIHQEMHERYGPSIAKNLHHAGVSYDSAFKSIKNELTVRKMTGYMVHSKAFQQLTPVKLQKAYQELVKENPPTSILHYQMISVEGDKPLDEAYAMLQDAGVDHLPQIIVALKKDDIEAKLSDTYAIEESKLAKSHKAILDTLSEKSFSKPIEQVTRKGDKIKRIFVLHTKEKKLPPAFKEVEQKLTDQILNVEVSEGTKSYVERLRKKHPIVISIPKNFKPFEM